MSNCETRFCASVKVTPNQEEWLKSYLTPVDDKVDDVEEIDQWFEDRNLKECSYDVDAEVWPYFDYEFRDSDTDGRIMVIDSLEVGVVDMVEHVMHEFLKAHNSDQCFGMEWAYTSDDGECGGGAIFVTAKVKRWTSSMDWLAKQEKKFNEAASSK